MKTKNILRRISAFILLAFGFLTLFLSTSIIFDCFEMREKQGNYVLFIVWANFISSLLYLLAAYGWFKVKKWTTVLLGVASAVLILAFILLRQHIAGGGLYETKTVGAMIFRSALTIGFTFMAYFTIQRSSKKI